MRPTRSVCALLLAAGLVAQAPPPTGAAREALDKIVAADKAATDAFTKAYKELQETADWKRAQAAKDREALQKLYDGLHPVDHAALGREALAAAQQFAGDDALALLVWAARNGRDADVATAAIAAIRKDHTASPMLLPLMENAGGLGRLLGKDEAMSFLTEAAANNKAPLVRAWALFWQASLIAGRNATDDQKAEAAPLLAEAEKLAAGTMLADRIAAPRFEQERLQIGMTAPDIEGNDTDGVAFKLSDYRGKVVVLDFWGFW